MHGAVTVEPQMAVDADYRQVDRKSTRLNSSHRTISYAVFCLKKKKPSISGILPLLQLARHHIPHLDQRTAHQNIPAFLLAFRSLTLDAPPMITQLYRHPCHLV